MQRLLHHPPPPLHTYRRRLLVPLLVHPFLFLLRKESSNSGYTRSSASRQRTDSDDLEAIVFTNGNNTVRYPLSVIDILGI